MIVVAVKRAGSYEERTCLRCFEGRVYDIHRGAWVACERSGKRAGVGRRVPGDAGDLTSDVPHREGGEVSTASVLGIEPPGRILHRGENSITNFVKIQTTTLQPRVPIGALFLSHVVKSEFDLRSAQLPEAKEVFVSLALAPGGLPQPKHTIHLCVTIFI